MANDVQKAPTSSTPPSLLSRAERDEHDVWLTGRITTLLGHFYQPDEDPAVFAMQIVDWVDALGGYPQDTVQKACRHYLSTSKRRPTIADILGLCHRYAPTPAPVQTPQMPTAERREPRVTPEQRAAMVEDAGIKSPMLRRVLSGEGLGE